MAGALRYHISVDGDVLADVSQKSAEQIADFAEIMARLVVDPRDKRLGVLPLKDARTQAYTVPFDQALLTYSITADMPCIRLMLVSWL
jgi:hypothetical protein